MRRLFDTRFASCFWRIACAQTGAVQRELQEDKLGTDCAYENVFVGPAIAAGGVGIKPTFTGGVTTGQYFISPERIEPIRRWLRRFKPQIPSLRYGMTRYQGWVEA